MCQGGLQVVRNPSTRQTAPKGTPEMSTLTRTARTGLVATRDSETEFPGLWDSWQETRTAARREYREDTRRRLGIAYHCTPAEKARIGRDAVYLARCDNWDAAYPEPLRVT